MCNRLNFLFFLNYLPSIFVRSTIVLSPVSNAHDSIKKKNYFTHSRCLQKEAVFFLFLLKESINVKFRVFRQWIWNWRFNVSCARKDKHKKERDDIWLQRPRPCYEAQRWKYKAVSIVASGCKAINRLLSSEEFHLYDRQMFGVLVLRRLPSDRCLWRGDGSHSLVSICKCSAKFFVA